MKNLISGIGLTFSGIGLICVAIEHLEGFMCFGNICIGALMAIVGVLNLLTLFVGNKNVEKKDNE